jgi:amidase
MVDSWQQRAQAKRESILAAIPKEWRIENPPRDKQLDVTGSFIQQYLDKREIEITETTADDIVKQTVSGKWSAEEVTRAFCHRAALAHQLVCLRWIDLPKKLWMLTQIGPMPPRDLLRCSYCRRKGA